MIVTLVCPSLTAISGAGGSRGGRRRNLEENDLRQKKELEIKTWWACGCGPFFPSCDRRHLKTFYDRHALYVLTWEEERQAWCQLVARCWGRIRAQIATRTVPKKRTGVFSDREGRSTLGFDDQLRYFLGYGQAQILIDRKRSRTYFWSPLHSTVCLPPANPLMVQMFT